MPDTHGKGDLQIKCSSLTSKVEAVFAYISVSQEEAKKLSWKPFSNQNLQHGTRNVNVELQHLTLVESVKCGNQHQVVNWQLPLPPNAKNNLLHWPVLGEMIMNHLRLKLIFNI